VLRMVAAAFANGPFGVSSLITGLVCFFSAVSTAKITRRGLLTPSSLADINFVCICEWAFL
jgi:hypothetical protein